MKRIGIFTSGGDCSGLNAAIRAITIYARNKLDWKVFGILDGPLGLCVDPLNYIELSERNCDLFMLKNAGTILGSVSSGNPFAIKDENGEISDTSVKIAEGYYKLKLDALIAIGGDGSMNINQQFIEKYNLNIVGIPKTIDNDLSCTDFAIGYSTAVDVATEALDRLHPTGLSHKRVFVLEVMGRDAGHIALSCGIAGGADAILIPEIPYNIDVLCDHITKVQHNKKFALVVVSEAVKNINGDQSIKKFSIDDRIRYGGIAEFLSTQIAQKTKLDTRFTVLGHLQRGEMPNAQDRILATSFGIKAVDLIKDNQFGRIVVFKDNKISHVSINDAIKTYHKVQKDSFLINVSRSLGIYVGEL